jgi:hypothetical protein
MRGTEEESDAFCLPASVMRDIGVSCAAAKGVWAYMKSLGLQWLGLLVRSV